MFTKALKLTAALLLFSTCQLQADVIHSRWIGRDKSLWDDPSNWVPSIVPNNTSSSRFIVNISTIQRTRIGLQQNVTIDQLNCYGDIDLENHSLDFFRLAVGDANGLTNYGKLEFSGRQGPGHVITGNTNNTAEAYMQLSTPLELHGSFSNSGTMLITPVSDFSIEDGTFQNTGTFMVYEGSMFVLSNDLYNSDNGTLTGSGLIYAANRIVNSGTIYASAGDLVIVTESFLINTGILSNNPLSCLHISPAQDVNNLGTIGINVGGGVAFDCNLVNEPNAVIKLLGGTLAATTITQKAGATFQGFGGITGDVVIDPNAVIKLTGPTNIVGDLTIGEGATLDISDGTVLVTGLTTCNSGTIQIYRGTLITQGGESGGICRRMFVD